MKYLGNTLGAIATQKAGIIKPGVPVVIGKLPAEAQKVIEQTIASPHLNDGRPEGFYLGRLRAADILYRIGLRTGDVVKGVDGMVFEGPQDADGFLPALLRQVLQARASGARQISVQSSPHFTRDYVHLDDVVDALIRIALQGQASVYNVASGANVSNAELFDYFERRWGCAAKPLLDTRPAPTPRISTERLRTELQWQPRGLLAALDSLWATGPGA